ncbi:MAG: iron-sulfur cluster biosynthesis protein [Alkalibacterium sp.]|uniref:HesB/YadR/YfhF family protein n=1 Tax=Alkalibacterium sp. TaxID=1872447 RepID=UPI003970B973
MEISLTDRAIKWFEDELTLESGDAIRFFGKTYGKTEVHEGFSVGISVEQPDNDILGKKVLNGITYYAGAEDDWFFSRYDLVIDYDKKKDEPIYHFNSNE